MKTPFSLLAATAALALPGAVLAQTDPHAGHGGEPAAAVKADDPHAGHEGHETPPATDGDPHAGHEGHGAPAEGADAKGSHGAAHGSMPGALGAYPSGRDASGTGLQPDVSPHAGLHAVHGDWTIMAHLTLNGVCASAA